jgi:response regulator NasT
MQHSLLIVSGQEKFETLVKNSLEEKKMMSVETRHSAASARRALLERYFDLVLINAPLPDENGVALALDAAENRQMAVLLAVPQDVAGEITDRVVDAGVLVAGKPLPRGGLGRSVRFLMATLEKLHEFRKKVEKAEERLEEQRILFRAKLVLIEQKGITEEEAHRLIQKQAMDSGLPLRRVAEEILD